MRENIGVSFRHLGLSNSFFFFLINDTKSKSNKILKIETLEFVRPKTYCVFKVTRGISNRRISLQELPSQRLRLSFLCLMKV